MTTQTPSVPGFALPSYERPRGLHPPLDSPGYRSTELRAPRRPLVALPHRLTEITGPLLGEERVTPADADLTTQHAGEPLGARIIVTERLIARFDLGLTQPDWALGFEWDIVLRGPAATAIERAEDHR